MLSALAPRDVAAQRNPVEKYAGCYKIQVGPWTPFVGPLGSIRDLPTEFRLLTDTVVPGGRVQRHVVMPPGQQPDGRREHGSWVPIDSTSFRVVWSNGFSDAALVLFDAGIVDFNANQFWGVVRTAGDVFMPEEQYPKATVVGRRLPCQ